MASFASTLQAPPTTTIHHSISGVKCSARRMFSSSATFISIPCATGLRLGQRIQVPTATTAKTHSFKAAKVSCSAAEQETLQVVQSTIAKQLSIDESTVLPGTKFADLGADSLDTVEIMMALEEKFGVSIGEGGAENIATVQDAADLIEKVKVASA